MKTIFLSLIFIFVLSPKANSFVECPDLQTQMNTHFLEEGEFSDEKLEDFKRIIQQRRLELTEVLRNYELLYLANNEEDVVESLQKEDVLLAFNIIETYLNQITVESDDSKKKELAWRILELEYATKVEGYELLRDNPLNKLKEIIKDHIITRGKREKGHAYNLVNPRTGGFYSQAELNQMVEAGEDLSLLNPSPNSRFWYQRDIPNSDVKKVYYGGDSKLYKDLNVPFPETNEGTYLKVKKSQTKPKVHFKTKINGESYRFKLKFGAELASELTAGALIATLGYHFDVSKYVTNFKLKLPEGMTFLTFKREWLEYYENYDPDDYITSVSEEDGKVVITFREGLLEARVKDIERLGPWAWGNNGHQSLREIRGLYIFNMWIGNNDVKESGNNKLVLRRQGDDYQIYQYVHDLGFSFGRFSHESPGDFPWDLVQFHNDDFINFRYFPFQKNSGFSHVTFEDGKWMTRQIAQMTRKQIFDAVEMGGWPESVQKLYVEKLINRRNQLVEAFDLKEEYGLLEVDREITTENGDIIGGRLRQSVFEGHSQQFGSELTRVLQPIYENMNYIAAQGMISLVSSFDTAVIDSRELGYDSTILAEVEFNVDREIRRNEMVQGNDDNYIVMDTLRVRFSLGAGIVLRGKVNYYKEYKLLYPAKTLREATFHNQFILNALLPRTIRNKPLPENYVILIEDGFEGEGELLLGGTVASVGFSKALGRMSRTIVSKRLDSYSVYRDYSPYQATYARLYAELFILRIPVMEYAHFDGILRREQYDVQLPENPEEKSIALEALDHLVRQGRIKDIKVIGEHREIVSEFDLTRRGFDLFFLEGDYRRRIDHLSETLFEADRPVSQEDFYQVDIERNDEWQYFSNGEMKNRRFRLTGDVASDGTLSDVKLDMRLFIKDMNATSQEFENAYLMTFDQLSMQENFLNFTPSLHSTNQIWHGLQAHIHLMYNQEALDKLIDLPIQEYHELMARTSNRDANFWASREGNREIDRNSRFIRTKYHHWIRAVESAKAAQTPKERYTIIADAFSNIVWLLSDGYQGILLQRLHSIIGKDKFYMEGLVDQAIDVENTLPMNTPLYNVLNPELMAPFDSFEFDYRDLDEIWELFQS